MATPKSDSAVSKECEWGLSDDDERSLSERVGDAALAVGFLVLYVTDVGSNLWVAVESERRGWRVFAWSVLGVAFAAQLVISMCGAYYSVSAYRRRRCTDMAPSCNAARLFLSLLLCVTQLTVFASVVHEIFCTLTRRPHSRRHRLPSVQVPSLAGSQPALDVTPQPQPQRANKVLKQLHMFLCSAPQALVQLSKLLTELQNSPYCSVMQVASVVISMTTFAWASVTSGAESEQRRAGLVLSTWVLSRLLNVGGRLVAACWLISCLPFWGILALAAHAMLVAFARLYCARLDGASYVLKVLHLASTTYKSLFFDVPLGGRWRWAVNYLLVVAESLAMAVFCCYYEFRVRPVVSTFHRHLPVFLLGVVALVFILQLLLAVLLSYCAPARAPKRDLTWWRRLSDSFASDAQFAGFPALPQLNSTGPHLADAASQPPTTPSPS